MNRCWCFEANGSDSGEKMNVIAVDHAESMRKPSDCGQFSSVRIERFSIVVGIGFRTRV